MDWFYAENGATIGPNSFDAMKHHIKNSRVNGDTLIWCSSFGSDWKPVRSVMEFAALFAAAPSPIPPPLPALPPAPPAAPPVPPSIDEPPPQPLVRNDPSVAPPSPSSPQVDDGFPLAPPTARDALAAAGPWSRYFARQIDLTIWSLAFLAAVAFGLVMLSPPSFYRFFEIPEVALGFIGVFAGQIINGIVIAIFGNSIGKAIFGIKVFGVGSDRKLSLGSALKRELKVWVYGLGLGIPLVTLVAIIVQYRKVSAGNSTGYDAGHFLVRQKRVGAGRITLGIVVSLLMFAGLAFLNIWGNTPTQYSLVPWSNPDSGLQTTLSSVWQPERQTAEDGSVSTILLNSDSGEQILVGLETYAGASLPQYTDALTQSLSANATISRWTSSSANTMTATGTLTANAIPIDLYVHKVGDRFWRVLSFDLTAQRTGHFIDQAAQAAILKTLN